MIKPAVPYALETWKFSVRDIKIYWFLKEKILRKTFGAVRSKEGLIVRNNNELQELIKGKYTVQYVTNTTNKIVGYLTA
jgi:hypothetical protein